MSPYDKLVAEEREVREKLEYFWEKAADAVNRRLFCTLRDQQGYGVGRRFQQMLGHPRSELL